MDKERWREETAWHLKTLLEPDDDVLALALFGSVANPHRPPDVWSDLDVLLVVKENAHKQFYPALDWLQPLGERFAHEHSSSAEMAVTRVCFADLCRLDLVIITAPALMRVVTGHSVPFWQGTRLLISRSPLVDEALSRAFNPPEPPLLSPAQFETMVNGFWFRATVAITKVVRNDLLIALHLALELVQECCVLAMLLRDRAEGTNVHREGGLGNGVVARLEATRQPHSAQGILDTIQESITAFDALAREWTESYHERRQVLLPWLQSARHAIVEASSDGTPTTDFKKTEH